MTRAPRSAKIEQQPYFQIECLKVVYSLRQVNILQPDDGFQFDSNSIAAPKIDPP